MARLKMFGGEIATAILLDICLLVALALSNYNSVDEHRILVFKEPVQDKALHGHVIRTVQVLNEGSCRVQCYLEPNCVSINVRPLKDGKHQCELNNATDENQSVDALKPMTGYTYFAIEENPCSCSPCYNNGTCQAGFTRKGFRCICPVGVVGNTCSRDLRVGCFKIADQFEDLHDFTGQVKWNSTIEVVKKCAKLAKDKQFKMFALGDGGVCFSGPDMKEKFLNGSTINAECRHGIGIGNSMFVYSLELFILQPLGCYQDKDADRALPHQYANFRGGSIIWDRLDLTVSQCAQKAYDIGYEYFAVQFYGVCYGNGTNYAKHGNSKKCQVFDNRTGHGVGEEYTNFVYLIKKREQK